jgi:hypothetical protein
MYNQSLSELDMNSQNNRLATAEIISKLLDQKSKLFDTIYGIYTRNTFFFVAEIFYLII